MINLTTTTKTCKFALFIYMYLYNTLCEDNVQLPFWSKKKKIFLGEKKIPFFLERREKKIHFISVCPVITVCTTTKDYLIFNFFVSIGRPSQKKKKKTRPNL